MTCRYCKQYIERALKEVKDFEKACRILRLDPAKTSDWEAIVQGMYFIGQNGTIRLARGYPFVTNEEDFRLAADVALHFYWMILDFWEDEHDKIIAEWEKNKPKEEAGARKR